MTKSVTLETKVPTAQALENHEYEQNNVANLPGETYMEDLRIDADESAYSTTIKEEELSESSAYLEVKPSSICSNKSALERKQRTRKLIDMGGLIVKAGLDPLKSDSLYGALLTLKQQLVGKTREEVFKMIDNWTYLGSSSFKSEKGKGDAIAVKFKTIPNRVVLDKLKTFGFKYNGLRKEWEGKLSDIDALKLELGDIEHEIQAL